MKQRIAQAQRQHAARLGARQFEFGREGRRRHKDDADDRLTVVAVVRSLRAAFLFFDAASAAGGVRSAQRPDRQVSKVDGPPDRALPSIGWKISELNSLMPPVLSGAKSSALLMHVARLSRDGIAS